MKTIKIEKEYHDKVKSLSDASGQTMLATVSSVLAAGLGELEGLGKAINTQALEESDTGLEEEEEEGGSSNWIWAAAALIGGLALVYKINQVRRSA